MFGFFKRKQNTLPTFAPLVTDMHCHLLPLVDDGSKSLEESLEVMEAMKAVGYQQIKLTPHFSYPRFPNVEEQIMERYAHFCDEVEANKGDRDMPRMTGCTGEYNLDDGFQGHIDHGNLLTYRFVDPKRGAEKGLLLVETSLHHKRMGIDEIIFNRLMDGYDVILAHPERYPYYDSHSSELEQLKEQGVYFQCNVLSLDGFYGEVAQRKAFEFIENGWVEFLGTDMHNVEYSLALRHASTNKKIIKLMETTDFENKNLAVI